MAKELPDDDMQQGTRRIMLSAVIIAALLFVGLFAVSALGVLAS